jgi:superfamily I DNA/RNA helicase
MADFEKIELPFCSRCPQAIVNATNRIIQCAQQKGHFKNRIPKKYECFLDDKEADSIKYPKVILANCTTAAVVAKYVHSEILKIDPLDIAESNAEGNEYPTVLIVGTKQYLQAVDKHFKKTGVLFDYTPSDEISYGIVEAYEWLLRNAKSNLGWRILAELFFDEAEQKRLVKDSETGVEMTKLLDSKFVADHLRAIKLVRALRNKEQELAGVQDKLKAILGAHYDEVASYFPPKEDEESADIDKAKPTILLTSFLGCKGLSAGHVFIIGVHNGSMPKNAATITDVEISQFIVALTRTRKQCHIVSDRWLVAPVDKNGKFIPAFQKSAFVSWIPTELIEDKGKISAKDLPK